MRQINSIMSCLLLVMIIIIAACKSKNAGARSEKKSEVVNMVTPDSTSLTNQPSEAATEPTPEGKVKVKIHTRFGDMVVKLYDETPKHRDNFVKLVQSKFYDGLLFHRVIKNFMVQGGDPDSKAAPMSKALGMGGPGYKVPGEFNKAFIHKKGALAAARQGDQVNPQRESSGSQFYIVQGQKVTDMQLNQIQSYVSSKMPGFQYTAEQANIYKTIGGTPNLDMDYTVFGEVIEGLNIIDSIAAQPTSPSNNRPLQDIVMSMELIK